MACVLRLHFFTMLASFKHANWPNNCFPPRRNNMRKLNFMATAILTTLCFMTPVAYNARKQMEERKKVAHFPSLPFSVSYADRNAMTVMIKVAPQG